ncbi:sugar kinase [Microbacterium sp.]|uniref:sugar kinase n=1 Tax=Microbacterium sp. TaxID=51671 RepID=UPI000929565A|nr:sugar kinase [Microbacterium sp.]MBN9193004.1 sugar kinase [Microbacterium sp.]OJU61346.1 MAG: hypothetical protein BGO04_10620 [Microbacterium sp. 70-38]
MPASVPDVRERPIGPDVITVGETLVQLTPPHGARVATTTTLLVSTAGAESNVASHLARLGHRVAHLSAVGDDAWGSRVVADLADAGVDVSRISHLPGAPTGLYTKAREHGVTRVSYHRTGSAASRMGPDDADRLLPLPRIVHFSGVLAALSPSSRDLAGRLLRSRRLGARISFDVNHRAALWTGDGAAAALLELARGSDIVFVGRDEAERLWGCRTDSDLRALIPDPEHLVIRDDDREAVEWRGLQRSALAPRPVEVIEPVGAGDAFAAGWLSALLDDPEGAAGERLRRGHALAALVLESLTDHPADPTALASLRPGRGRAGE